MPEEIAALGEELGRLAEALGRPLNR